MFLADLSFQPGIIAGWLMAGVVAGWLASQLMSDVSYGVIGEVTLGAAGGLVAGLILGLFMRGEPSLWLALLVAFVGGCVVVVAGRVIVSMRNA